MFIADKTNPRNSFCLDNSIAEDGTIKFDFVTNNEDKIIKIGLVQIKLLADHLQYMLKEYEQGKNNRNPSI